MSPIETLRSFVDAWECDENDHLNVQFYFGYFEDAAAHFFASCGLAPIDRPIPLVRHVRFHSELRGGQLIRIDSHAANAQAPDRWHLVHRLSEPATRRMAATALDTFPGAAPVPQVMEVFEEARPRSLAPGPTNLQDLLARKAPVTHRGRLGTHEIAASGHPFHRALVARFSSAAPHLWESVGAVQPWLAENKLGRVALEMKVTTGATMPPGLVELRSGPQALGGKTLSFSHIVTASDSGALVAGGEVTALLFDQAGRRAIELPDEIRSGIEKALANGPQA
jgi:acyl-CoA thioester hydrolase